MSSLAPVPPPESAGGGGEPPLPPSLSLQAPSAESDDISPMPVPVFLIPPPLLSPPSSEPIASPLLPPLVVVSATPPPTPPPTLSPPPPPILSPPLPPPQLQPQPPLASPPPITQTTPPQNNPTPPIIPPLPTITTKPPPPEQPTQPLPQPGFRKPKTQPSPFKQSPSRPKLKTYPTSSPPPTSTSTSPLPTSAILPSPPPVALPVPQAPGGGAWFPLDPPSPLPIFPGPPGPPLLGGPTNGNIGIPSAFAPSDNSGADHQNIEAASASSSSSGRSNGLNGNIVLGFCVAGVLLLLLGAVFVILVIFCRRREKRFADYGSGSKHGTSFSGFEDKTSLSHYTKQDSNVANSQAPNFTTSGPPSLTVGPTSGVGAPLCSGTFTYEELVGATDGFSGRNLLGQGGFGYVHKGVLPNGKEIAVKQLKMGGDQGEREFRAEVDTISQVHHKHLVSLVGYCIAGAERLLVYEFVSNNNLEFHLHGKGQPVVDWPTRLKIAIGSARGLAYLHEDCNPTIIHRDIKASNILLDYNFEAKVSDFGMAKIFTSTGSSVTHMTTRVVGTFGYLAPEYASSGKVTDKSDVYSYGVMLLELITGRPPISNFGTSTNGSLVNWARPLLTQAIGDGNFESLADPRLRNNYNVDEMASMVACAAACVRLSAWRRPRMSQVVHALEGNLPLSELDDGTRPGHSAMQFPYESLDFDAHNYMENLKRMAMTSNISGYTTSRYSENTSEYGLHPSASSTDTN